MNAKIKNKTSEKSLTQNINPNIAVIKFQCNYETLFGQQLHIVGNIEELGSWDKTKSIPMSTNNKIYPDWESSIEITCPIGMTIEYKYLLYDGNDYIWESLPNPVDPRKVTISIPGNFIIINAKNDDSTELKNTNSDILIGSKCEFETEKSLFNMLSYENNKISCDVFNDTIDFSLSQKIEKDDRIIITTTFLPIKVLKQENGEYTIEAYTANTVTARINDLKEKRNANVLWVGILPDYKKYDDVELADIEEFLQDNNYFMVFPSHDDYDNFFLYIHKILFPIFNDSLFDIDNEFLFKNEEYFEAFQEVNILFANTISHIMQEKDLVVIKDLGLALVSNSLVQKNYNVSIGIYFDYPIPSSDIVRIYPKYQEIIKSILLCDVIGFHFFYSARNFMAVLERFFGLFIEISKKGLITVTYLGRTILFHVSHCVIDVDFINELKQKQDFKTYDEEYKRIINGRYTIMTIDHQIFCTAISTKIRAIDLIFENNQDLIGKVVFFFCIKHFSGEKAYMIPQLENMIKEIRSKYGENTLIVETFSHSNISKRLALMKNSNIFLYPFYYQGHCIFAHEFLALQNENKNYGIILGEHTCATANIKSVIKVNAFSPCLIANTIQRCYYSNPNKEQFNIDYETLKKSTTLNWIYNFLLDMKRVKYHDSHNKFGMGLGLGFGLVKLHSQFKHLEQDIFLNKYNKSTKRIFFFEYENTLHELEESVLESLSEDKKLEAYTPSSRLVKILNDLALDKSNLVIVLSRQSIDHLLKWFGSWPSIAIAGECGYEYRYPNQTIIEREISNVDVSWKEAVLLILKAFTEKTGSSYIEEKQSSLCWVYKNCDSYFGYIQANEIKTHLENVFGNKLEIVNTDGLLSIKPKNINKGYFISHILQKELLKPNNDIDFIFAAGSDVSNENMFKYLRSAEKYFPFFNPKMKVITATIGRKPSTAQWYFNEMNELIEYLEMISLSNRRNMNMKQKTPTLN